MAHAPLGLSASDAEVEVGQAWNESYSPDRNECAIRWLETKSLRDRIIHLCSRLAFRGIYFPQMKWQHWVRVLFENRRSVFSVAAGALELKFRTKPRWAALPEDAAKAEKE